jgi:hypothetical protein
MTAKTHADFIPPWQDMPTLCKNICATPNTVNTWVAEGILPPPRKRGGKLMWKWSEVDQRLTDGDDDLSPDSQAEEIKNAARREAEARSGH